MPFTTEHDKFLIEAYYRSGEKVAGEWMYDIRSCQSEFYAKFTEEEQIDYDVFAQHVRRLVARFERTGGICKAVPRRKATKLTRDWLRDFLEILQRDPKQSIRNLAQITGLSYGTCQKALQIIDLPERYLPDTGNGAELTSAVQADEENAWIEEVFEKLLEDNQKELDTYYEL